MSCIYFCDASQLAYAAVGYTRPSEGSTVSFVCGKARVNPMKVVVTVPRLELVAALLGAKMCHRLLSLFRDKISSVWMWSDSMVVIRYLRNTKDRFPMFIANRVEQTKTRTNVGDWKYVSVRAKPSR